MDLTKLFAGKKSYAAAAGFVALAALQFYSGDTVGGVQSALAAAGIVGLRAALETTLLKLAQPAKPQNPPDGSAPPA